MRLQPRYRAQIIIRVLLIVATSLLLAYFVGWTSYFELWIIVGALIAAQVGALIWYGEKTARDVTRFLESIRHSDFSIRFTGRERGPIFERLANAFEGVTEAFRRVRAERQEHLRYLEHVVHNVGVALISYGADGEVQFVNPPAKRLLGISRISNVRELSDISHTLVDALLSGDSGGKKLVRLEREGRLIQVQVTVNQFRLHDELYVMASLHDIGNELEAREMEAWQKLTKVLTHEIMNSVAPIASLASTADDMLKGDTAGLSVESRVADDVREAVKIIERRSRALVQFVEAYRSFTRIPPPSFEMLRVRDKLLEVRRLLGARIAEDAVACEIEVEPDDLILTADPQLIEQVLINLLLNAIDALDGQESAIITLRAHADERGIPVIEVHDNGPGLTPEAQDQVFVPFFTTKENGSGIGLSLSRQIMRLHDGTLSVRSEPGRGTEFIMRF